MDVVHLRTQPRTTNGIITYSKSVEKNDSGEEMNE